MILTVVVLNALVFIYMVMLWGSVESLKAKDLIKEPALYTHLFKFKFAGIPLGFVVSNCLLILEYVFILLTSLIFGLYSEPEGGGIDIYDWYIITIYSIPLGVFAFLFYRSTQISHCMVCGGDGIMDGYQELLKTEFNNEKCFCCSGKGNIRKTSEKGKIHELLGDNLLFSEEKLNKAKKLKKEKDKLLTKLESEVKINESVKSHLLQLTEKIANQMDYQLAAHNFYDLAASKLMIVLFNHHLAEYLLEKTKEFEAIEERNEATYVDIEVKKHGLELNTGMIDEIERLVQEISLHDSVSITKELQNELEEITQDVKMAS
ncbi:MAG: hypothetical protein KTR26_11985 [Flammeovirgaceae bacterium]|nr:hypothetical protein [Flammeovirgaceae bacterium]